MSVIRYLFPPDEVGAGDFLIAPVIIAVVLAVAHWARVRDPRPLSARTMRRLREQYDTHGRGHGK